ncbi:ArsR/SmtB family transcription factor [Limoniibacter endophyticus]|uniref:Transcriptional regulator n=1 Tax=Limoniibacter endophyticus TaxID=1565040 RepID=A0A8J3GHX5_9HYPH|nr:metalloregulator ArsR/SmtB family transcription factor [Limoniibacter endophyticus]GHC68906.1 transcriptional regulator [Limoniibacter endophyticus]
MVGAVAIDETLCMDVRNDETVALRLAALSHPRRIQILRYLSSVEHCCCKEVVGQLDLAQSTVSQHLKVLVEAGLVRFVTDKQRSRYEVDRPAVAELSRSISRLLSDCC